MPYRERTAEMTLRLRAGVSRPERRNAARACARSCMGYFLSEGNTKALLGKELRFFEDICAMLELRLQSP